MSTKRVVHVVGTGTLGEPLISLLLNLQRDLEFDELTFHKNRPLLDDRVKILTLMRRGAKLTVEADKVAEFEKLGLPPTYTRPEALAQATVVIDCTEEGLGLRHQREWYDHLPHARGFIAQGSEFGFGKMYAHGINDAALVPGTDRFLQVVSCNTHNLAVLLKTLALQDEAPDNLLEGASCACGVPPISVKPRTLFRLPTPANMGTCRLGRIMRRTRGICFRPWGWTSTCFPPRSSSIRNTCTVSGSISACGGR